MLRAIAEKLIPGIPEGTRIAILQQSRLVNDSDKTGTENGEASTLNEVIERATAKQVVEQDIKRAYLRIITTNAHPHLHASVLSEGVNTSDSYAPVRALRQLKHNRHQQRLFRLDKDARLRSGARGMQARKALVAYEKVVAESNAL